MPIFSTSCVSSTYGKNNKDWSNYVKCTVENIYDGDTISVLFKGKKEKIRFYGIDTPESGYQGPISHIEKKWATTAYKKTLSVIQDQNVFIYKQSKDKYNRFVAIVKSNNNIDIGLELVKEGLARVAYITINKYDKQYSVYGTRNHFQEEYYWKLIKAENQAKKLQKGFWKEKKLSDVFGKIKS